MSFTGGRQMQRFRLAVLSAAWVAGFFYIVDRINISLAAPALIKEFGLTGTQMGTILSAYFWGFIPGNFLGGMAADNWGLRRMASFWLGAWCVLTALTASCDSFWQFCLIRGMLGFAEGAALPCCQKLHNNWLLPNERGKFYGVFEGSTRLGAAFGLPMVGWLIGLWQWRGMFLATSCLTLLVFLYFWLIVRDHPREHPWISPQERDMIHAALDQDRGGPSGKKKLSFKEGLSVTAGDWAFWLLCLTNFMVAALYFANMTWLPGFMVKERGYTAMKTGIFLALPFLAAALGGLTCGYLGDWLKKRSLVGIIFCIVACPAMIGAVGATTFWGTELLLITALFFSMGAINSVIVLVYDLYPIESFGTAIGIVVGVGGGLSGLIAPLLIGFILDATGSFFWGFSILSFGTLAAGGCFAVLLPKEISRKAKKAAEVALAAMPASAGQTVRH